MIATTQLLTYRPQMDILSSVLRDLRLASVVFSVAEFRAPWGFDKRSVAGAPFCVVVEGRCLVCSERAAPIELTAGDLIVVPNGRPYALMSSLSAPRVPFTRVLEENGIEPDRTPGNGLQRVHFGGTGTLTRIITGMFTFRTARRSPILAALPALIHVPGRAKRGVGWLESSLQMLIDEATSAHPGYQMIVERLADIIFVQAVREAVRSAPARERSWFRGLSDPQIARALALIHAKPDEPWTVAALANAAALSRTGFAERFRKLTGASVMAYVTRHRMHVAEELLARSSTSLAEISREVGYRSEIAFSRAFSRRFGMPPGRYRRRLTLRASR